MGRKLETRFRPAFYPFVEPGLDLDVQCVFCEGRGCPVCKHSGWIELIPGGLVHPEVFRACDLDPDEWQGFAFGMGFDRMVMLRYGIDDIRRLYDGRLSLVRQF
jgi:phenylalanyl-tRNA synthetase alpha chain